MIERYKCNLCGFPEYLPQSPNSQFGKIVFWRGVTKESIIKHIKEFHEESERD